MVYPFCVYNSGRCYREKVNRKFFIPFHLEAGRNQDGSRLDDTSLRRFWLLARQLSGLRLRRGNYCPR
jgi:hypothetical protein